MLSFEAAAKSNLTGTIFTWAYSHPCFTPILERIETIISSHRGQILFVFLHCSQIILEERVTGIDRKQKGKIYTVEKLRRQQIAKNHVEIPGKNSLVIDNSYLQPEKCADKIVSHFKLPRVNYYAM